MVDYFEVSLQKEISHKDSPEIKFISIVVTISGDDAEKAAKQAKEYCNDSELVITEIVGYTDEK